MTFRLAVKELKRLRQNGIAKERALPTMLDPEEPIDLMLLRAREVAYDPYACVCNDCLDSHDSSDQLDSVEIRMEQI